MVRPQLMRQLIRGRGGRIIHRRRRHIFGRRVAGLLPPKPRKPPSGFNLFIRDYFRTAMARNFHTAPAVMPYAGQIWRNNPLQRQRYENQARPELARYRRAYADYQAKKQLLKRPGNAFICFAKDLWHNEGNGRSISEMARLGSGRWRRMTPAERSPFIEQARAAKILYDNMLTELNAGRARLEDYLGPRAERRAAAQAAATQAAGQALSDGQITGEADEAGQTTGEANAADQAERQAVGDPPLATA